MELLKKSERGLQAASTLSTFRKMGAKTKEVGEYKKWKEIRSGRLSVSLTVYRVDGLYDTETVYLIEDSLGRVCAPLLEDLKEITGWLKEHGYKTAHRFYVEEAGMSEETWRAWNSTTEEE